MKTSLPKDNNEIIVSIGSILDRITNMEKNITECQHAIVAHADEARKANKELTDTVSSLQFSVTGMQIHITEMQNSIKSLIEVLTSVSAIARFIVLISKVIFWSVTISGAIVAILKGLGKI